MKKCFLLAFLLNSFTMAVSAAPQYDFLNSEYFLGDWGGKRQAIEDAGFSIEMVFKVDLMTNVSGGTDTGFEAPGNLDLVLDIDTGTAGWWSNGRFHFYLLGNEGGNPSDRVGDLQTTSNIEADNTFKMFESWYEHRFFDGRLGILFGLHDLNSEFYVLENALSFVQSSFGNGPELSQFEPSIFPVTALAARISFFPTENSYLLAAVYDGVPGDPARPHGTHINFDEGDGVFAIFEAGRHSNVESGQGYYKFGLGFYHHTKEFTDVSGETKSDNTGIYFIGEKRLFSESDRAQGLGAFVQLGFVASDRNQTDRYFGAGINYIGLIPNRNSDEFGLGVAHARNSDDFLDVSPTQNRAETALELFYRMDVTPWLTLQPDIQYIINPGTVSTGDDALVINLRLEINL